MVPFFAFSTGFISGLPYWAGQEQKRTSAIQISGMLILFAAVIASIVSYFCEGMLAPPFVGVKWVSLLFGLSVLGQVSCSFFEDASVATGRLYLGVGLSFTGEFIRTASIVTVALIYRDITAVIITHTIISLVRAAVGIIWARKLNMLGCDWDFETLKEVVRYALPVSTAAVFGFFMGSADQFILSRNISAAEFAVYSIGCLIVPPVIVYEQSVTRVMIPLLAKAFANNDTPRASELYRSAVRTMAFFFTPLVMGLMVFASPFFTLLFTDKFSSAAQVFQVAVWLNYFACIPSDAVPRATGKGRWILNERA